MELLKNKIDKTSQCLMLFPHTKWIISFDDIECDTPNSSYDNIEFFDKEFFDDIEDPIKDIEDPKEDIKDPIKDIKDPIKDIEDPKEDIEDLIKDIKDPIKDIEDPKEDIKDPKEDIEDPKEDIKDPKEDIEDPKEDIKDPKEDIKDPKEDIEDPKEDIKINKIEKKDICPFDFFKQSLDLYEDDDIIKNKLFIFIATPKISNKYTKKGISMIMDGITQNKWNIYICKLFSFLLDISFEYRKQNICETKNSKFVIKK
jgi:peptidoglycan hydrolase CwlO-like protein